MRHAFLRPLTTGEVLDGAFSLYRANFGRLFLTALIPVIPVALAWVLLAAFVSGAPDGADLLQLGQLAILPFSTLASLFVWGALILQADRSYQGDTPLSLKEGYAGALRRLPTLLGALILAALIIGLGFLLVIPGIIAAVMFFAVAPVVVLENRGATESLGRSRELARGAKWRIFRVLFLLVLITSIPSMAVGFASALGVLVTTDGTVVEGTALIITQLVSVVGTALTTPLLVTGVVLQYYDRRVRAEGLDIELAAEQLSVAR